MHLSTSLLVLAVSLPLTLAGGYGADYGSDSGSEYGSGSGSSGASTKATAAAVASATAAPKVAAAAGEVIKVNVGSSGLTYSPSTITAPVGAQIEFTFYPRNHTVTQSSFKDPCHPLAGGFDSSFVPTSASPSDTTFTITVKDAKPIWIYCAQGNHCQGGMVMAVNPPSSGNTFEGYVAAANTASKSTAQPGGAAGGVLAVGGVASDSDADSGSSVAATALPTAGSVSTYTSSSRTFTTTFAVASIQTGASGPSPTAGGNAATGTESESPLATPTGNAAARVAGGTAGLGNHGAVVAMVLAAMGFAAVL